jgi:RHS repeat-associated protein
MPSKLCSIARWLSACALLLSAFGSVAEVGTIPGSLDVSLSGSATYNIPLRIVPGTAGTEPKIALSYNSQAGVSAMGPGWSLTGVSTITRGPRTLFEDGRVTGVNLSNSDALYLDGERMLPIRQSGPEGAKVIEYRKAHDDITRIIQMGSDLSACTFWVHTKGGLRLLFDGANNSRVKLPSGQTLLMAVSRIIDTPRNYVEFKYSPNGQGSFDVASIGYTGYEKRSLDGKLQSDRRPYAAIDFQYEKISQHQVGYVAGQKSFRDTRLKKIVNRIRGTISDEDAPWQEAGGYELTYKEVSSSNGFVLSSIAQFGDRGGRVEPTKFEYSDTPPSWQAVSMELPVGITAQQEDLVRGYRFVNMDSSPNKLPDLLFSAQIQGKLETFAFRNDGGTWTRMKGFDAPHPFISAEGLDLGVLVEDINGDGRSDLIYSSQAQGQEARRVSYLAGADKWEESAKYQLPFDLSTNGSLSTRVRLARISGGAGPDLLFETPTRSGLLINTADGWKDAGSSLPVALTDSSLVLDVNCDGKAEIVSAQPVAGRANGWKAFRYEANSWTELADKYRLPIPESTDVHVIHALELSGDGCRDVIVADEETGLRKALVASADGWREDTTWAPIFSLKSATVFVLDLNGDARQDVVSTSDSSGSVVTHAYANLSTGWSALEARFIPASLPSGLITQNLASDLNGDGYVDLALPGNGRSGFGRVYSGSATGFVENPAFVPAVAFARQDQQDHGLRFVDLNADGLADVLFSRAITRDGKIELVSDAFTNTGKGWSRVAALAPTIPFAADDIAGNPVQFVDVDGDGFIDMLYGNRNSAGEIRRAFFRNEPDGAARKWVQVQGSPYQLPADIVFAAARVGDTGVRIFDVNGDGRPDILSAHVEQRPFSEGSNAKTRTCDPAEADGGPRRCHSNTSLVVASTYLNTGAGWQAADAFKSPLPFVGISSQAHVSSNDLYVHVDDLNGDGLPDLLGAFMHPTDQVSPINEAWINTGTGWYRAPEIISPVELDLPSRDGRALIQWVDVNGDGLNDLVLSKRVGDQNYSTTWMSTGTGFERADAWRIPLDAMADRGGDQGFRLLDVSGDGLIDIVFARIDSSEAETKGFYLNRAQGWAASGAPASVLAAFPPLGDKDGLDNGVRFCDVDGNGLIDVLRSYSSGASGSVAEQLTLLNAGRRSEVLRSIDSGYGLRTSIFYQTMLEAVPGEARDVLPEKAPWTRVYEHGVPAPHPYVSPVPAAYVVRRVLAQEAPGRIVGISYRYGGYRMHAAAFSSLGFGWREALNEHTGVLTRTELTQQLHLSGHIAAERTCLLQLEKVPRVGESNLCPDEAVSVDWRTLLTSVVNEWSLRVQKIATVDGDHSGLYQVSLRQSKTLAFELDGAIASGDTSTFEYDEPADALSRRMNVLTLQMERADGTSVHTTNEYKDDESKWLLARLIRSTIVRTGDSKAGGGERQRETRLAEFAYDSHTGLLLKEVQNAGNPMAITVQYELDQYGNVRLTRRMAAGEVTRVSERVFDESGRFTIEEINPATHRIRTKHRHSDGLLESLVDSNNLETRYEYDEFGRQVLVRSASGAQMATKLMAISALPSEDFAKGLPAAFAIENTTLGLPPSYQVMDSKGRVLRTISDGFSKDSNTPRWIFRDLQYDALGRVVKGSLPYGAGDKVLWATTKFDALGRAVEAVLPSGLKSTTKYTSRQGGGRKVIVTDQLGRSTTTELNERGLPVILQDANKALVRYTYDAGDRIKSVVGPTGAVTIYDYDASGRRERISDPDIGSWSFSYNPFGEIVRQVDSKNQVTTVEYDVLGRMVRKVEPESTSTWTYDTAQRGVGSLASIGSSSGYRKEFEYDQFGRSAGTRMAINGEQFASWTELDLLGRMIATYYPAGSEGNAFVARYVYDAKGFLTKVTDGAGAKTLWEARSIDNFGRITSERFGNGVTSARTYDADEGYVRRITTKHREGGDLLDLSLDYDAVGNLKKRSEATTGIAETFSYDRLDRLVGMKTAAGSAERYDFDAAGRMIYRTGTGSFTYPTSQTTPGAGTWQPYNAAKTLAATGGQLKYEFDSNGNLVRKNNVTMEYTSDNRLKHFYVDQYRFTKFEYAPDGDRVRQISRDKTEKSETIYAGAYERISESLIAGGQPERLRLVRHRYYLGNAEGVFATVESNTQYLSSFYDAAAVPAGKTTVATSQTWYLHKDQLGSVLRITDSSGRLAARFWYDPWGKRAGSALDAPEQKPGSKLSSSWARGFTGHEHLDRDGLIHMNGRVYDQQLATFTSADPVGVDLTDSQGIGRYAYARGNPLRFTDPTGYFNLGKALGGAVVGFLTGGPAGAATGFVLAGCDETREWIEKHWREIVIVAAVVVVTIATGGAAATLGAAILQGMAVGATTGALSAALYGGSFNDILAGAIGGALIGGATAGAFYNVGTAFSGVEPGSFGSYESIAAHGVVGGGAEAIQGGNFWEGFASAAVTKASGMYGPTYSSYGANVARAAIVGGAAAAVSGGKFANGAITGAFSYAFNDAAHELGQKIQSEAKQWVGTPYAPEDAAHEKYEYRGPGAVRGEGADCSGSVHSIYAAAGAPYDYTSSNKFADQVSAGKLPFTIVTSPQPGDVVLQKGHMSIYANNAGTGKNLWSARNPARPFSAGHTSYFKGTPSYYRYKP